MPEASEARRTPHFHDPLPGSNFFCPPVLECSTGISASTRGKSLGSLRGQNPPCHRPILKRIDLVEHDASIGMPRPPASSPNHRNRHPYLLRHPHHQPIQPGDSSASDSAGENPISKAPPPPCPEMLASRGWPYRCVTIGVSKHS